MRLKRLAAAGAATILATLGLAGAVQAADVDQSDGTLTIHKYETPAGGPGTTGGDGTTGSAPVGATPIQYVEFSATQVLGVDLQTTAGWTLANDLLNDFNAAANKNTWTPTAICPTCTLGTANNGETDVNGELTFGAPTPIPVGLYLVKETGYNNAPGAGTLDPSQLQAAEPFLVTIPMPDPANAGDWNYDVHVYPKNTISAVQKTVNGAGVTQVGDTVTFDITTSIPAGTLTKYEIVDPLPVDLGYTGVTVKVVDAAGTTTLATLATPAEYTVTAPTVGTTGTVTVTLTGPGAGTGFDQLETLLLANPGAQVITTITTEVLSVPTGGTITNNATFYPDNSSTGITTGPGTNAQLKLGGQNFKKVDATTNAALPGATFEVYESAIPTFQTTGANAAVPVADPATGATRTVTSATGTGQFDVDGLRVSDWDGAQLTCPASGTMAPAGCKYYWLVETVAPAGYVTLAAPVMFTVDDILANATEIDIANVASSTITGTLPLTGMGGILLLVGLGAIVLAGAGYGMYRVSRSKA